MKLTLSASAPLLIRVLACPCIASQCRVRTVVVVTHECLADPKGICSEAAQKAYDTVWGERCPPAKRGK